MSFFSKVYFIKEDETTSWDYLNGSEEFCIFKGKFTTIEEFNEIDISKIPHGSLIKYPSHKIPQNYFLPFISGNINLQISGNINLQISSNINL